jgi:peptidoglycan L-alanyl-D-glutamate endopeptidase CwlK
MSRKIEDLHPKLQELATAFKDACDKQNFPVTIYFTLRTIAEQDALYAQGRITPGKIVTNAKGGQSYHNYGLAFDAAPLNADLSIDWSGGTNYQIMGKIGQSVGLEWGGTWSKFPDKPHFQYTFGLSINDLISGKRPPEE